MTCCRFDARACMLCFVVYFALLFVSCWLLSYVCMSLFFYQHHNKCALSQQERQRLRLLCVWRQHQQLQPGREKKQKSVSCCLFMHVHVAFSCMFMLLLLACLHVVCFVCCVLLSSPHPCNDRRQQLVRINNSKQQRVSFLPFVFVCLRACFVCMPPHHTTTQTTSFLCSRSPLLSFSSQHKQTGTPTFLDGGQHTYNTSGTHNETFLSNCLGVTI